MDKISLAKLQRQGANQALQNQYHHLTGKIEDLAKHLTNTGPSLIDDFNNTMRLFTKLLAECENIYLIISHEHTTGCGKEHTHVYPDCCGVECWCLKGLL